MNKRKVQVVIFRVANNNKKQFLLLKMNQKRGFFWQNITGGVEKSEDFKKAALREAKEETNIKKSNIMSITDLEIDFEFKDQWDRDVSEKVFAFQCKQEWDIVLDPKEHCEYNWISENELKPNSVHYPSNYQALIKVKDNL